MKETKVMLGLITTSRSFAEGVIKIAAEKKIEFQIAHDYLDEAIATAKEMEKTGCEAILCRGLGTSHMLRDNLRIPVLSFPHTSFDVLKCLKEAAIIGRKVLFPVFGEKLSRLDIMEELLDIKLIQGVYYNAASLEKVIEHGKEQGCEVAVAGLQTMQLCKKYGLKYVDKFKKASQEVIDSTIENAKSVVMSNREEQRRSEKYRCIIDSSSEGIIAVENDGTISTINKAARKFLKIDGRDVTGEPLSHYIPEAPITNALMTGEPIIDRVERVNKELFVFNFTPVNLGPEITGCIATFKDISHIMRSENKVRRSLARGLVAKYSIEDLIHSSPAMKEVINTAVKFSTTDSTVLITGETGTGKEILAHSIHNMSHRKKHPFVSINCAALPEQLLESELFGYEEGSFTGSKKGGKPGLFEIAHKGTIFLDEISTTPQSVQNHMLRVLEEKEVMRIGADRVIPIDVRVIASANKDLGEKVKSGSFREDLLFRLDVLNIYIPPLAERMEDIPALVYRFMQDFSSKYRVKSFNIQKYYLDKLMEYSWPGNVRQLRNFIERLVLLCGPHCNAEKFEELYSRLPQYDLNQKTPQEQARHSSLKEKIDMQKKETEAVIIRRALEKANFSKIRAAEILGISRTTLWKKLKQANIC